MVKTTQNSLAVVAKWTHLQIIYSSPKYGGSLKCTADDDVTNGQSTKCTQWSTLTLLQACLFNPLVSTKLTGMLDAK